MSKLGSIKESLNGEFTKESDLLCGQKHSNTIVRVTDYGHPMKA